MTPDRSLDRSLIVVFGATGDLMQRKLLPALFHLSMTGALPAGTKILGVARDATLTEDAFRDTSARVLESIGRPLTAREGKTDIFIYPPYQPKAVDALLTNFHLPKSTLLMLVSAFAGREFILRAYAEAIASGYRFYSYGDCVLIL